MTSLTLLALIMLWGKPAMPFIAATLILFAIGRISFLRGYANGAGGRAFGMVVTMTPSIAGYALAAFLIIARLV